MSWVAISLAKSEWKHVLGLGDNRPKALAAYLNKLGATVFHDLSEDSQGDIGAIAWVDDPNPLPVDPMTDEPNKADLPYPEAGLDL